MLDAQHNDFAEVVVDGVQDTVRPTSSGPDAGRIVAELLADSMGLSSRAVVTKSMTAGATASELDGERLPCRGCQDEFVWLRQDHPRPAYGVDATNDISTRIRRVTLPDIGQRSRVAQGIDGFI